MHSHRDLTTSTQSKPKFNQRVYAYINSLPRGEQKKATNALRNYVYGPGKMQADDAIERYNIGHKALISGPLRITPRHQ